MEKMMNFIETMLLICLSITSVAGIISLIYGSRVEAMVNESLQPFEMVIESKLPETSFFDSIETEGKGYTHLTEIYKVIDEIPLWEGYQVFAQAMCEEHHVNYAFFLAMCESESNFDDQAIGDSGKSKGLMQINRPNWNRYELDASFAYDNLEIGIRMMSELIQKYEEVDAVIMAYKGGEGKANKWIEEGFRLSACDTIVDRTMYWQDIIDKNK